MCDAIHRDTLLEPEMKPTGRTGEAGLQTRVVPNAMDMKLSHEGEMTAPSEPTHRCHPSGRDALCGAPQTAEAAANPTPVYSFDQIQTVFSRPAVSQAAALHERFGFERRSCAFASAFRASGR